MADLGSLGDREGPRTRFLWTISKPWRVVPWLGVLALLALKSNRTPRAWWIWAPLVAVAGTCLALQLSEALSASLDDVLVELVTPLGFGLTAVWLLAAHLARNHRFVNFLLIAVTLAAGAVVASLFRVDPGTLWTMIPLSISAVMLAGALTLAGLICRRAHGAFRLATWSLGTVFALWSLLLGPFFLVSARAQDWSELLSAVAIMTGLCFGVLLPFLALAFAQPFYRLRLNALLRLEVSPPVAATGPADSPEEPAART
jgi:hypothetical protein